MDKVGKHRNNKLDNYNSNQLKLGIKIEKEHSGHYKDKVNIAKDHLAEIPDYYTRLVKMEKNAPKLESINYLAMIAINESDISNHPVMKELHTRMKEMNEKVQKAKSERLSNPKQKNSNLWSSQNKG